MLKHTFLFISSFFILGLSLMPATAGAIDCSKVAPKTPAEAIQCGTDNAAGVPGTKEAPGKSIDNTIANVINLISAAVGIAAVVMIMVGGFRYITSGGKQESVTSAKNTILYAIIGLVIVALAQVIVRFVLNQATNTTNTTSTTATPSGETGSGNRGIPNPSGGSAP